MNRTGILFNVKYSENLGDGIIAEALEKFLRKNVPNTLIKSCDLAGRNSYFSANAQRSLRIKFINLLPKKIRIFLIEHFLKIHCEKNLKEHYESALENAAFAVLGGGNLFSDIDLNFPSKINTLVKVINQKKIPFFVFSVGVSEGWSQKGKSLLNQRFINNPNLKYFSVRDKDSLLQIKKHFPFLKKYNLKIDYDPGLLISRFYPFQNNNIYDIGISIISASEINYHSKINIDNYSHEQNYLALIEKLLKINKKVLLFCNGNYDDINTCKNIYNKIKKRNVNIIIPKTPFELCCLISSCKLILAHRLHALITGFSYKKNIFGFIWDKKIESFFKLIGHKSNVLNFCSLQKKIFNKTKNSKKRHVTKSLQVFNKCDQGLSRLANSINIHCKIRLL